MQRLIECEELERRRRGLERRLAAARIGRFKPLADFDWRWPAQCDQDTVSGFMTLGFIPQAANLILVGPNGVGKSMIAQNIPHHAVMRGHSALFINVAHMLGDLAARDGDNALRRWLKHCARPDVPVVDEIGYLSYGNRHADLLFNIVNRRYELKPTIVTTNRPFAEWSEVFSIAACAGTVLSSVCPAPIATGSLTPGPVLRYFTRACTHASSDRPSPRHPAPCCSPAAHRPWLSPTQPRQLHTGGSTCRLNLNFCVNFP